MSAPRCMNDVVLILKRSDRGETEYDTATLRSVVVLMVASSVPPLCKNSAACSPHNAQIT